MQKDGAHWLSQYRHKKLRIECDCGLVRQYDAVELLDRAGDWRMPMLLRELARRNGCMKHQAVGLYDRCRLHYDFPDEPFGSERMK